MLVHLSVLAVSKCTFQSWLYLSASLDADYLPSGITCPYILRGECTDDVIMAGNCTDRLLFAHCQFWHMIVGKALRIIIAPDAIPMNASFFKNWEQWWKREKERLHKS